MKWKHLPIVAFDTETTGLDPWSGDRVIEIGMVVIRLDDEGRVHEVEHHNALVNPGIPIPRKVTEITGITDADVAGKPPFHALALDVAERFKGAVAVAHNYPFDDAFLRREFELAGVDWQEPLAAVDTVDLSMKVFPEARGHKLAEVAKRVDVRLVDAHRAANDAEACGRVFAELARRHSVPDDLQAMLDWADAIGRPPEEGPLDIDGLGLPIFVEGPHAGEPVSDHPIHLAWMAKARQRTPSGWTFRYPESTRRWVSRYLNVRGAGRAKSSPKTIGRGDWGIDCCIAEPKQRG